MAKTVNYTPENVARLREVYNPEDTLENRTAQVQALAMELGKTPASIRAKLSHEGLYVKAERKAKDGSAISPTKEKLAGYIAKMIGLDPDVTGLEKANKVALKTIAVKLAENHQEETD